MTTQKKIESKGYKVIYDMNGNTVFAEKNGRRISAPNVTQLLKKIQ